jgi:hypothetical protein
MPEVIFREGSKSPQARINAKLGNLSGSVANDGQVTTQPTRCITTIYGCGTQAAPEGANEPNEVDYD